MPPTPPSRKSNRLLPRLPLLTRVLLMTMALTPLMVFVLVPLLTRLLRPWLATARDVRLRV